MNDMLRTRAAAAGGVFTTSDARLCGYDKRALRRLVATGTCQRITRGLYAVPVADARPEDEHVARTRAFLRGAEGRVAASHHSALLLHGLRVFGADLSVVHVVRLADRHTRRGAGVAHHLPLPGTELTGVGSCAAAVDVATALVQLAMLHGITPGVVSADAALHQGLVRRQDLAAAVTRVRRFPGSRAAAHVLRYADSRSESVGETRLRLALIALGIPVVPQHAIHEGGQLLARADFLVRGARVVIEFDGLVKYRAGDGEGALVAEKLREDRIRSHGYEVVRVTWRDLDHPEWIAARARMAIARARPL